MPSAQCGPSRRKVVDMATRWFSIVRGDDRYEVAFLEFMGIPARVPWSFVESHSQRALINHAQSLERLNQRGGLSLHELYALVTGRDWRDVRDIPLFDVATEMRRLLKEHDGK